MSRENQNKNTTITDYSSFRHWGYKKLDIIANNNLKKRDKKIEKLKKLESMKIRSKGNLDLNYIATKIRS